MDVETNCSQQTLLFSPLRRPRTLACSLPALALFPLRSSPTTPTLQLSQFFLLWCVRPAPMPWLGAQSPCFPSGLQAPKPTAPTPTPVPHVPPPYGSKSRLTGAGMWAALRHIPRSSFF
ncbi:hypothetical protein C8J57DRAFT_1720535 [Mycena rebaudengoi]|nr:hypothetical protein C8J57DRAFT_1720535 [Mycena rebaudengoi]